MRPLDAKRVLITGGTGSLGSVIVRRLLSGDPEIGLPSRIIVFSRDEAKQHQLRLALSDGLPDTEGIRFQDHERRVEFVIGDVRNIDSIAGALSRADVVINTAALKQVPSCEYYPHEAVLTNVLGATNIVQAIQRHRFPVETVVGVSTDKACKPVNVMGMSKAIQERVLCQANLSVPGTRFVCVRYGNVLASRGSVIPLFLEQIAKGGPVTVTSAAMTRFFMTLDQAVDTIFDALKTAQPGETLVPRLRGARIQDLAKILIGTREISLDVTGSRPGEKVHEVLISEEEVIRTRSAGQWYVILPILPELRGRELGGPCLEGEFTSADNLMSPEELARLLAREGLIQRTESRIANPEISLTDDRT